MGLRVGGRAARPLLLRGARGAAVGAKEDGRRKRWGRVKVKCQWRRRWYSRVGRLLLHSGRGAERNRQKFRRSTEAESMET